ncbi:MAG: TatD family hydrolase [Candidatus Latescibacteria bacterium]|jgi:predicted TIM-barrel fold metal-dependent hydrolase|nr:TatD family hydrolase [Candidatus Latescibacterota bacterium]
MSSGITWVDTHVHVSNIGRGGEDRGDILPSLLDVMKGSGADLRFAISVDGPWIRRMMEDPTQILEGNRFIHDLANRAPDRLRGACTINPHFLDASLDAMRVCFEEWEFPLFGEMLPYIMDYRMNTDSVATLVRAAAEYGKPVQVHISTSNSGPQGPFEGGGTEQLEDLMDLAERVPEANTILAHFVGTEKDDPPVVSGYLDQIERRYGSFPGNFWAEIRDFNSPGVPVALERIPKDRLIVGTDWVTREGPPFLPYGVVFGTKRAEDNPHSPGVERMVQFLADSGATEDDIEGIAYRNAAGLLRIEA